MTTTEDARTWARRIVEETLVEAGFVAPSETSRALPADEGPPPPPSLARQAAHRIVEAVQREHEAAAASRARSSAPPLDEVAPTRIDDAESDAAAVEPAEPHEAEVASNGHHGSRSDDSEAANRARRIVAEVMAAEEARQVEEAAARTSELPASSDETAELSAPSEATQELSTEPDAGGPPPIPTASVDLLPAEPTEPAGHPEPATQPHPDEPTADLVLDPHEAPAPGGPVVEGPPPPPLALIDGWWQRLRARYRRRQAMAQWAPDAARPPRRTGRWLLVTIVAVAAIALLFPMAVDALRQLVAL